MDDAGTAVWSTSGWRGRARLKSAAMASHTRPSECICPLLKQWRQVAKGKATAESAGLREAMVEYLRAAVSAMPGGTRDSSRTA